MFSAKPLLVFHSRALTLQRKFEFSNGLKVIRCCLGSLGKSGEAHPHLVASLAQPFVIKLRLQSCCIPFKGVSVGRRSLASTIETIVPYIKYILTFVPVSCIWQLHHSQYRLQKLSHRKYIQLKFKKISGLQPFLFNRRGHLLASSEVGWP